MRDLALRKDGELATAGQVAPGEAACEATLLHQAPADGAARPALLPLRVDNLGFEAGGRRLIDALGFTLDTHGITMVMGPNGAGKSLLLRLLHGLIAPTNGEISWGGRPLGHAIRQRQALVFQKPVLLRRSAAENIDFVLRLKGAVKGPAAVAKRDDLLESVGLLALAQQPARRLSGGEQQRLSLARALATAPEILLLDEPTASLDPASVLVIERIVAAASRDGVRIVFVTHDLGQARRLADDVVFLNRGRLAEHARAEDFFKSPSSQAARDFLAGRIVL